MSFTAPRKLYCFPHIVKYKVKKFPAFLCENSFYKIVFKLCFAWIHMKRTNLLWLDNSQADLKNYTQKKKNLYFILWNNILIESSENVYKMNSKSF